jgi:hypothetical protein
VILRIRRGRLDDAGEILPRGVTEASDIEDGLGEILQPLRVRLIKIVGEGEGGPGSGAPQLASDFLGGEPMRR